MTTAPTRPTVDPAALRARAGEMVARDHWSRAQLLELQQACTSSKTRSCSRWSTTTASRAPPGEPGSRVLLTNLVNRAQPLIRYELSDAVVLEHEPDPSGRPYLRVARVDGRSNDILRFPAREGGEVAVHPYRLRAPFSAMLDVRQYQLVRLPDGLLVRIVARASAPPDLPNRVRFAIARGLDEAGAAATAIRVELVREIEREPGHAAKVKLVTSAA